MAGIDMVHVPYRGVYMTDLLAGQVQVVINPIPQALELIRSGKMRALARDHDASGWQALPDMPTVAESVPGYEAIGWYGARRAEEHAGRDRQQAQRSDQQCLADPKLKARLADLGVEPMPMTPAEFDKFIASETDKWTKVIKAAGVTLE